MNISGIVFDLDGTVYRGTEAVPGVASFVEHIMERGVRRLFVTNRANRPPEQIADQLRGLGLACGPDDILTSAQATAEYLRSGTAHVVGGVGLRSALEQRGIRLTDEHPDYVVVGYDPELTYRKLTTACRLILAGARFIATNPDRIINTEAGVLPETGPTVAALREATGVEPVMIGKPKALIMETAAARLRLPPACILAVGDNLETDIPAGAGAGMRTALILTGVSTAEDVEHAEVKPDHIVSGYEELTCLLGVE